MPYLSIDAAVRPYFFSKPYFKVFVPYFQSLFFYDYWLGAMAIGCYFRSATFDPPIPILKL